MTKTDTTVRATVLSERAWAGAVAEGLGLRDAADLDRVQRVLAEAGVTPGRPPSKHHRLRVRSLYFAGIKVIRNRTDDNRRDADKSDDEAPEHPNHQTEVRVTTVPFSFQHTFGPGFTAFATDGINDAGKSTILGVLLWAIRGSAPNPTLQGDIRDSWLRDAVVTLDIDGATILVQWRIDGGRPEGAIYSLVSPVDLAPLRDAGREAATREQDASGDPDPSVSWPGQQLANSLSATGDANLLAVFETADEFEAAASAVMMPRLDLEPVKVWQKRPGAVDQHDATVVEHGWKTLALALAITEPTSGSVLGEHTRATQHLLTVFLGSTWSVPTLTARWQQKRAEQLVAGARRRFSDDAKVRQENLDRLKNELASAKVELEAFGDVPAYPDILDATEKASKDALSASLAQRSWLAAESEQSQFERELSHVRQDLHALVEAAATKRFWHSLRPSCCPRCDKVIGNEQWAREQEGHCSLCDGEFIEVSSVPDLEEVPAIGGAETDESRDNEDNEDEIAAVRAQVAELETLLEDTRRRAISAKSAYIGARKVAEASGGILAQYHRTASTERRQLEDRISILTGRVQERMAIDAANDPGLAAQEFASRVFKSACDYATKQRDAEQRKILNVVSEVITDLGAKFGVRNLVSAKLGANGHLPVKKGVKTDNFSDLSPGERLRLRIALIVGLLQAGTQTGTGRHPGLLIVDDLTTQEINHENAAAMVHELVSISGLQVITASTYATTIAEAAGKNGEVVTPPDGSDVMF